MLRGVLSRRGKGTGAVDGAGELAPVDLLQGKEPKIFRMMPGMRGREIEQPEVQKGVGVHREDHEHGGGYVISGEQWRQRWGVNRVGD